MAPTLLGPHLRFQCPRCNHTLIVDAGCLQRGDEPIVCSQCGESRRVDQLQREDRQAHPGDVVQLTPAAKGQYRCGDLVAVRLNEGLSVKRIAAVPGDVVTVNERRLRVNDRRVEDSLEIADADRPPLMLVDDDSLAKGSRWRTQTEAPAWQRSDTGQWSWSARDESPWLVYHHQSVHDRNRPAGVLDDYQYNAAIARKLDPVDRLSVAATVNAARESERVVFHVAFWSPEGSVLASHATMQSDAVQIRFAAGESMQGLPVSETKPIAIRLTGGPVTVTGLRVLRAVEYRLRKRDDESHYPMTIPPEHVFVVGDNVPFSVDSRQFGPVPFSDLAGKVEKQSQ